MKKAAVLSICLLSWFVIADRRGQLMQQQPPSSGAFDPTNIPGMAWHWIMDDLATNAAVSSWADRIQGCTLTQGTPASRPTNLTAGVRFNGSQFLNAACGALSYTNTDSYLLVIQPDKDGAGGNMCVVADASGAGGDTGRIIFDNNETWVNQPDGPSSRLTTNAPTDLVLSASTGTNDFCYTNGIFAGVSSLKTANSFSFAYFGKRVNAGMDFNFFSGYIQELCIWTNTKLSSTQVSLLHIYAKTKYNFSP